MAEDGISYEIQGLSDVQKMLDDLTTKAADRCIRTALRAGAEIEQTAIVERIPPNRSVGGILPPGLIENDFIIRITKDDQGALSATIGPGKYTKRVVRWIEYGHRMVTGGYNKLIKTGKNAGKTRGPGKVGDQDVPQYSFIRPAYEATREEVANTICTTLAAEVEKASKSKGSLR